MDVEHIWNGLLSIVVTGGGFWLKSWTSEVHRLNVLLNKTREEYQSRSDALHQMDRVMSRLDGLDAKIDRILENGGRK